MADIKPPFTDESARTKVKAAQNLWNKQDPEVVAAAYTTTSLWRNRDKFFSGTEAICDFLSQKWAREDSYRLRKELFAHNGDDRIAVQFWYEYRDRDDGMKWKRCYGIEHWTFQKDGPEAGKMKKRMMSGNDVVLGEGGNGEGRWFGEEIEDVDQAALPEEPLG
ncbi:hypothetical protein FQN54_002336 [Arachnomyces sp. PD_36]|nr:hypothetical protein FQN54_002336 [Arachnomyces sp. PD_36]